MRVTSIHVTMVIINRKGCELTYWKHPWALLEMEILLDNRLMFLYSLACHFLFFNVRMKGTYCITIYKFPNLMTLFVKKKLSTITIHLSIYKIPVAGRSRKRENL